MNVVDVSKLKNRISELMAIYLYEFKKEDELGGDLYIIIQGGNVCDKSISMCKADCIKSKDVFGELICDLLLLMSERKRWNLYLRHWDIPKEYRDKFIKYFSETHPFSSFQRPQMRRLGLDFVLIS